MRKITFLALAILPISNAIAANDTPPTFVSVQNNDDKSSITGECDAPGADGMHCRFTQTTITKPDETKAGERIAKNTADIMKAPASEFKGCDKFGSFVAAAEMGKAPPEVADKKGFEDNWAKMAPEAKADTLQLMKSFASFCANHDPASADAVARASEQLEGSTCKISNWTFEKTFTLNYSTKRWQSTVQNDDSCGTIEYSELSKADESNYPWWNYTAKIIVTNPSGKNIVGHACSETDQREHRFTWQKGKLYANCRYIDLGP